MDGESEKTRDATAALLNSPYLRLSRNRQRTLIRYHGVGSIVSVGHNVRVQATHDESINPNDTIYNTEVSMEQITQPE